MAEHLVKTLCHIVFILKLYSKFLLGLFHCPAYLQLAPLPEELCSSGNAADYQWSIGMNDTEQQPDEEGKSSDKTAYD